MHFSFLMCPEQPPSEAIDAAVEADRLGYQACLTADEIYHRDGWLLLAAIAQRTRQIRLGPCVAPIYMREPTFVAQLAATLDELSEGRAEVVYGIGNTAMLEQYGVQWKGTKPIDRLREAHYVMRTLLDDGCITFQGDFYGYSGITTSSRPVQKHLPLKLGAMGGPKSIELAGEIADGLHAACAYSSGALAYIVDRFRVGAQRGGRSADGLDLGDCLIGAIAPDGEVARRAGRVIAAFYIPSMPAALLERHDIDPKDVAPINAAFASGDIEGALRLTPPEIADRLTISGTPDDWVRWLETTLLPAGFNHALVVFADPSLLHAWAGIEIEGLPSLAEQVRLLGGDVLPHF